LIDLTANEAVRDLHCEILRFVADPIALEPVDDVVVTTLADNVYDALLTGDGSITRAPLAAGTARAPQFEPGVPTSG
jgi:7,8-dihydropterin-6-yl-methyl-4-(beta-D-ribofuranosyl)aminobenzene 5'-phosphate synthase